MLLSNCNFYKLKRPSKLLILFIFLKDNDKCVNFIKGMSS